MGGHNSLRVTIFTSEYCPGGHYSQGDTIHSDTGMNFLYMAVPIYHIGIAYGTVTVYIVT